MWSTQLLLLGASLCAVIAQLFANDPEHLKYYEDYSWESGIEHPGFAQEYSAKVEYYAPEFSHPIDHPPNTIAHQELLPVVMNNSLWTSAVNATWFILPVNRSIVQQAVPYKLFPIPVIAENPIFPTGFPNDTHPVIVQIGYRSDIQQDQAPNMNKFMIGALYVPYVDVLEDPNRFDAFKYALHNWVGHAHHESHLSKDQMMSVGASPEAGPLSTCSFQPAGSAYEQVDTDLYSAKMNALHGLVEAMAPEVVTMDFTTDYMPHYLNHTFHFLLNQPLVLDSPSDSPADELQCSRDTIYFTDQFSCPTFRTGNVTLHEAIDVTDFANFYENVQGFSATGQQIGYPPQSCNTVWEGIPGLAVA